MMGFARIRQLLKIWMLPIAMLGGILFHNIMGYLSPLSPYLIAIMLFITYCRLAPKEIRFSRFSYLLLLIQVAGSLAVYLLLLPFGSSIAEAGFICIFCPTATAAPVITAMLGGSLSRLTSFSLLSNLTVAILAPFLFTWMDSHGHSSSLSFFQITGLISGRVVPIILGPLVLSFLLRLIAPKIRDEIANHQSLSFYIWAVSLFIVVGNAVTYVMSHIGKPGAEANIMISIAGISLVACCLQFLIGRKLGKTVGDPISGAQGLGQKNTVLAVWMSLSFLNPISSVGPAAYVAWQNTINSLQLWYKAKKDRNTVIGENPKSL